MYNCRRSSDWVKNLDRGIEVICFDLKNDYGQKIESARKKVYLLDYLYNAHI